MSELDYPGGRAVIDGREASIQRTNRALLGVAVPAGANRVELRFESSVRHWGKQLSGVSAIAVFLMAVWARFGDRLLPSSGDGIDSCLEIR